jgi:hypothetical protein
MDPATVALIGQALPVVGKLFGGGSTKVQTNASQSQSLSLAFNPAIGLYTGSGGGGLTTGGSPTASAPSNATGAAQTDTFPAQNSPIPFFGSTGARAPAQVGSLSQMPADAMGAGAGDLFSNPLVLTGLAAAGVVAYLYLK